jgi:hypothetical protein
VEGTVINRRNVLAGTILGAFLLSPTLARDRDVSVVSDDPEPILGAVGEAHARSINDNPDPLGAISDDPEPIGGIVIDDGPDPFGYGVIDDGPDPISESVTEGPDLFAVSAISDGPDPISGVVADDPDPFVCIIDDPEPFGASIDDEPAVVHGVVTCIRRATVLVWVVR